MKTILLIDDDEDVMEVLKSLLSSYCDKVLVAYSLKEAAAFASQKKISLVVTDLSFTKADEYLLDYISHRFPTISFSGMPVLHSAFPFRKMIYKPCYDELIKEVVETLREVV